MVDIVVRDAGLGKAVGPATRNAREEVFLSSPREAGVQGDGRDPCSPGFPLSRRFRGNDGWADHRGLDALAGAEEVDRPPVRCQGQALREVAGAIDRNQDQGAAAIGHQAALQ
jgi:hypothetical protein